MKYYRYTWSLCPLTGIRVKVEVAALSLIVAQRTVNGFLVEHSGSEWTVESVERVPCPSLQPPMHLPTADGCAESRATDSGVG